MSFAATILIAGHVAYQMQFGNEPESDSASVEDVGFVLNWCRLGDERIQRVVHSYTSARSFTGDHLDAYAIRISPVDPAELTAPESGWYRCDGPLPAVVEAALDHAAAYSSSREIPWFPKPAEFRSETFYVYPWTIDFHGVRVTAVQIILIRPSDNMVFYLSGKT